MIIVKVTLNLAFEDSMFVGPEDAVQSVRDQLLGAVFDDLEAEVADLTHVSSRRVDYPDWTVDDDESVVSDCSIDAWQQRAAQEFKTV